eukprot:Unigene8571_Nuclearia_a/m.26251 Unigene8571_Nuclearia_a/g.26251  ORF Unigene8571_Nuclearia_a/g.26251 Unigene8571_Nuclearia_a/m.26251 type:complete len:255 (+) Unigene8571_Nuclearia_a:692-1456(+)
MGRARGGRALAQVGPAARAAAQPQRQPRDADAGLPGPPDAGAGGHRRRRQLPQARPAHEGRRATGLGNFHEPRTAVRRDGAPGRHAHAHQRPLLPGRASVTARLPPARGRAKRAAFVQCLFARPTAHAHARTRTGHMDHKPPAGHTHDALGGELYWAAGLSVFAPVPVPTLWNQSLLRLHGFVNAGNLARLHRDTPWQQGLQAVAGAADVTAGAGIVLNIQGARVELNYCFPLHGPHADRKDRGGQLGVGLSFL